MQECQAINDGFCELHEFLFETGNVDILDQPNQIYSCDETGFPMALCITKVIVSKGDPHVYQQGASTKAQITALLTASATAYYDPPLMFPGHQTTFIEGFNGIFPDAVFGHLPSGLMDQDMFYNWLEESFIPEIGRHCVPKPVLLLIDGAKVHISLFIQELCDKNNVRVAMAQEKQGIWMLTFPDRENTGNLINLIFYTGKILATQGKFCVFSRVSSLLLFPTF